MTPNPKLRFAVMRYSGPWLAWQDHCLRSLLDSDLCELACFITVPAPAEQFPGRAFRAFSHLALRNSRALRGLGLNPPLAQVPQFRCGLRPQDQLSLSFSDEDVHLIRSHQLDFILSFGSEHLTGPILQAPRHGVWAFRFGIASERRHGPLAFWELCRRDSVVPTRLLRLANENENAGAALLYKGFFPVFPWSWKLTLDTILLGCSDWPARVCRDILKGCAHFPEATTAPPGATPADAPPSFRQVAKAVSGLCAAFARHQFSDLFLREQWNIGLVRSPIQSFLAPGSKPPVEWLPPLPRTRFLADPFLFQSSDGNTVVILAEDYDHVSRKGHIAALSSTDAGRTFSAPIRVSGAGFDDSSHKSYPFLLERNGEIFCIPESSETAEVALYRAVRFPHRWERVCRLLEGVRAIDPTPFEFAGSWWMFYTTLDQGTSVKLFLSSAPALRGPWTPHPANPIKTDIRGSRPAGAPFVHDGNLYRLAQDSSHTYGGAVAIYRVTSLTHAQYAEELVRHLLPDADALFSQGFHTLAAAGNLCVVDGKRFITLPEAFPHALARKLRSLFRRFAPSLKAERRLQPSSHLRSTILEQPAANAPVAGSHDVRN